MSEEVVDFPATVEATTPEKGNQRRRSTGQTRSSVDGKKSVPNYLRASTGSCHDYCKYGKRQESETEPWRFLHRRRIERKPPAYDVKKIVATDILPDRKNYLKAKPKSSSDHKGRLPDSSPAGKQKVVTSEKRTLGSDIGKSKAASKLKSPLSSATHLSVPGKIIKKQVSPNFEISKQVSVKAKESGTSGKPSSRRTEAAIKKLSSSSKSPASSGLRSKDRNLVENTGNCKRIRVKNAVVTSMLSLPSKSSMGSIQNSIGRKAPNQKSVVRQRNQKIEKDCGIKQIEEEEVPEKTLYVINAETDNGNAKFDQSSMNVMNELPENDNNGIMSEHPPCPSPSPSSAESSSQQNSLAISSREEEEDIKESHTQYSSHEEEEQVGSEYSDGESEVYFNSESDETENMEEEVTSEGDGIKRGSRKGGMVHREEADGKPIKLRFRRGRVVDIQSKDNSPRRLKFRRGKSLGENESRAGVQRRSMKKREITDNIDDVAGPGSEKYALRHNGVQEKKDAQGLFNNVIEETASKLVETRKSKVKALVGAFETVISLQDTKASATNAN